MIDFELKIKFTNSTNQQHSAIFITGNCSLTWLKAILDLPVDPSSLRLYVFESGLFVSFSHPIELKKTPFTTFYKYNENLYLPANASLKIDVDEFETAKVLNGNSAFIDPVRGAILLNFDHSINIEALIDYQESFNRGWLNLELKDGRAKQIQSIELSEPLEIQEMFKQEADAIDTIAARSDTVDQPSNPIKKWVKKQLDKEKSDSKSKANEDDENALVQEDKSNWVDKLKNWTAHQLSFLNEETKQERDQEIKRLLELLDKNPLEGIRFALPFAKKSSATSTTQPGGKLTKHQSDFNLNEFNDNSPSDNWDLSYDIQAELNTKYRKIAQDEMNRGNHRRAAYIFASLLGDFDSAAAALFNGKYYAEAAILYRDYLNKPIRAAKSFEKAGTFNEAIGIYQKLKDYQRLADLYNRMGKPDKATETWYLLVGHYKSFEAFLKAADVLENKLNRQDLAIELLSECWPNSKEAAKCLEVHFMLLMKNGKHEQSLSLIKELKTIEDPACLYKMLKALKKVIDRYQLPKVKHELQDLMQVAVARSASKANRSESFELMAMLRKT